MSPPVDLNDIALFVHIVRAGSFAAAARRLGMLPNTVSRRMQGLEQQLGVRLLQRSTRRLTLTAAGSTLYERSAEQVAALAEAAREAGEGGELVSGRVRVTAPADFFRWFPVTWMSEFLAAYPKARLEFLLSDDKVNLIDQSIDVAIRVGVDSDSTMVARQIGTGHSSLVASPDYLATHPVPNSVAALSEHDCIVVPRISGTAVWKLVGPRGAEEVVVSGGFHANTLHVQLDATLAGLGVCLLPTIVTAPYVRDGQLVAVLPEYGTEMVGVYLAYPSRRQQPRAVSAFIEFTTARLQASGLI